MLYLCGALLALALFSYSAVLEEEGFSQSFHPQSGNSAGDSNADFNSLLEKALQKLQTERESQREYAKDLNSSDKTSKNFYGDDQPLRDFFEESENKGTNPPSTSSLFPPSLPASPNLSEGRRAKPGIVKKKLSPDRFQKDFIKEEEE